MNNYVFIVEGEGRGHLTQCISLYERFKERGDIVSCIIIGKGKNRKIPEFFYNKIGKEVEIIEIESPSFIFDKNNKGIDLTKTVYFNFLNSKKWLRNINKIKTLVNKYKPDRIINFYNILGGIFNLFYNHKEFYCIGHQYIIDHPEFIFPDKSKKSEINSFKNINKLTSFNCKRKIALSFYRTYNYKNILISPPIIREEIKKLKTRDDDFILCYVVNNGYKNELMNVIDEKTRLEIFGDGMDDIDGKEIGENVYWNKLDDFNFLDKMSRCSYYVTTSGFESVCESLYLGKNLITSPVKNHFEQKCNAKDLEKIGIKTFDNFKDIEIIENKPNIDFKKWVNSFSINLF